MYDDDGNLYYSGRWLPSSDVDDLKLLSYSRSRTCAPARRGDRAHNGRRRPTGADHDPGQRVALRQPRHPVPVQDRADCAGVRVGHLGGLDDRFDRPGTGQPSDARTSNNLPGTFSRALP